MQESRTASAQKRFLIPKDGSWSKYSTRDYERTRIVQEKVKAALVEYPRADYMEFCSIWGHKIAGALSIPIPSSNTNPIGVPGFPTLRASFGRNVATRHRSINIHGPFDQHVFDAIVQSVLCNADLTISEGIDFHIVLKQLSQ